MESCCKTTSVPRIPAVETSLMYMGTIMVSMPTENPAIARPIEMLISLFMHNLLEVECYIPAKAIGILIAPA